MTRHRVRPPLVPMLVVAALSISGARSGGRIDSPSRLTLASVPGTLEYEWANASVPLSFVDPRRNRAVPFRMHALRRAARAP